MIITKIVNEQSAVERLSKIGYSLREIYQETIGSTVYCKEVNPNPVNNGGYTNDTVDVCKPVHNTSTYFIMELDKDDKSELVRIRAVLETSDRIKNDLMEANKKLGRELKELEAEYQVVEKKWKDSVKLHKTRLEEKTETILELEKSYEILKKQCHKMEEDIGKVQNYIGIERMKEILDNEDT